VYEGLKAVHVLSAFAFVLIHGASAAVALRLRDERDPARVRALLDLSQATIGPITWVVALVMLASGIALGFIASWWSYWWIWAAVILLVVVIGAMTPLGGIRFNEIRHALGIATPGNKTPTALAPEEFETLLSRWDPRPVSWIGGLGLAAIVLLMVLKPY
jgi:hypothetical protein